MNCQNAMMKYAARTAAKPKKKSKKQPEKLIQDAVIKYLQLQNYFVMRLNSSTVQSAETGTYLSSYRIAGLGSSGASDVLVGKNGKIVFVEIKTKTGRQSESQKKFQNHVERLGYKYLIVSDLEQIIKFDNENQEYFKV